MDRLCEREKEITRQRRDNMRQTGENREMNCGKEKSGINKKIQGEIWQIMREK